MASSARQMRARFLRAILREGALVWPIFSALVTLQVGAGLLVGWIEHWRPGQALYFAFITGLTIGYGDVVPAGLVTRMLAVGIGLIGVILSGLTAAIAVRALDEARKSDHDPTRTEG